MTALAVPWWVARGLPYVWGWLSSSKFWIGVLIPSVVVLLLRLRRFPSSSVSIGLPFGLGSRTYDTSPKDRIVAWKLYVQLATRKAALPFDEEHDLITEVYDSLFTLFGIIRELLLELPPREFERKEGVSSLMLRVLNDGLRPHLTRWQSDFRHWWDSALVSEENRGKPQQEVQRQYPHYKQLVEDLKVTNTELSKFADELLGIARAAKRKPRRRAKIVALPPTPPVSPESH